MTLRQLLHSLSIGAAMTAVACGGSASVSPAAPTGVTSSGSFGSSSAAASTGAVITGRVVGGTAASSSQLTANRTQSAVGFARAATTGGGVTVTVVGTSVSTTTGPTGEFTLTGVPAGTIQLQFMSAGASATVTLSGVEASDRIEIAVTLNAGAAKVESENRRRDDNSRVEVNGRVTAVALAAGTFQVGTSLVTVPPGTTIRHGSTALTLADIKVGDHVEVKGTRTATGVTASEVKVERNGKDDDDDEDEDEDEDDSDDKGGNSASGEVEGSVSSLSGQCPSLSLVIKGVTVTTSAATKFDGITCSAIKAGTSLEVKGTRMGTTIAATKVERD